MSLYTTEVDLSPKKEDTNPLQKTLELLRFRKYVNEFDVHVKQACLNQANAISSVGQPLKDSIATIREETKRHVEHSLCLEADFVVRCESILKQDILKWEDYSSFYKQLQNHYEAKIAAHRRRNRSLQLKIAQKQAEIKALRTQQHISKVSSLAQLPKKEQKTEISTLANSTRVRTESSLPQLQVKRRMKTVVDEDQHYMRPIGMLRGEEECGLEMLAKWLEEWRTREGDHGWLEKVIFAKRNYGVLRRYLEQHTHRRKVVYYSRQQP